MMKTLSTLILLAAYTVMAQFNTVEEWQEEIKKYNLTFDMPEKYEVVNISEDLKNYFSFAITNKKKTVEVRYAITDLAPFKEKYEEALLDSTKSSIDPNQLHVSMIYVTAANISGGMFTDVEVGFFPEKSVKAEFGADAGATSFVEAKRPPFGDGWKYCQIVSLHLNDIADVNIYYMTNKEKKHMDLVMESFYSLRFN